MELTRSKVDLDTQESKDNVSVTGPHGGELRAGLKGRSSNGTNLKGRTSNGTEREMSRYAIKGSVMPLIRPHNRRKSTTLTVCTCAPL